MFLMIDNYDSFTYNLVQAFQMLGCPPVVIKNDDPRLLKLARGGELTRICLSPGPGRPSAAGQCLSFLKELEAANHSVPALGVCLGHQILGAFAGAEVYVSNNIMHGKSSDIFHDSSDLFRGLPNPFPAARYHSLLVREQEAGQQKFKVTARTAAGELMALAYLDKPWLGIQFHPESVLTPNGQELLANFLKI